MNAPNDSRSTSRRRRWTSVALLAGAGALAGFALPRILPPAPGHARTTPVVAEASRRIPAASGAASRAPAPSRAAPLDPARPAVPAPYPEPARRLDPVAAIAPWAEPEGPGTDPGTGLPLRVRRRVDGAPMALIPPGPTVLGARGAGGRRVRISRAFYLDVHEVTWGRFRKFASETGLEPPPPPPWGAEDDHPVVNVIWKRAMAYAAWAGGRLPTEAEWEHAAQGGAEDRAFPWGDVWEPGRANDASSGLERTAPVGSYPRGASRWGCHDLAGNVWEWCLDGYDPDSPESVPDGAVDPAGPVEAYSRNVRGGSYLLREDDVRTSRREYLGPISGLRNVGFRVLVCPAERLGEVAAPPAPEVEPHPPPDTGRAAADG